VQPLDIGTADHRPRAVGTKSAIVAARGSGRFERFEHSEPEHAG
jgi:hypothetical protein